MNGLLSNWTKALGSRDSHNPIKYLVAKAEASAKPKCGPKRRIKWFTTQLASSYEERVVRGNRRVDEFDFNNWNAERVW